MSFPTPVELAKKIISFFFKGRTNSSSIVHTDIQHSSMYSHCKQCGKLTQGFVYFY